MNQAQENALHPQNHGSFLEKIDSGLNPIWLLELRTTLRSGRFFASFSFALFICVAAIVFALLVLASEHRVTPDQIGKGLFSTFFFLELFILCVFFPAFTCTSIISEKERKTFDLLITSDMKPHRIVFGKFLAAYTYGFLFIIASMPIVMIAFLFGGVSVFIVAFSYALLLALGMLFILYSLWASTYYKSTVRSIIGSYTMILTYSFFGSFPLVWLIMDYLYYNNLLLFFSKPFHVDQVMVVLIPVLSFLCLCILPYLLTTNSLKPISKNRTTSLKIFYAVSILTLSSLFCYWGLNYLNRLNIGQKIQESNVMFIIANSVISCILLIGCVGFPLQSTVPGIAFEKKPSLFPTFSWLLAPGAWSGAMYMGSFSLLCYMLILFFAGCLGFYAVGWAHQDCFITLPLVFWSFLFFVSVSCSYFSLHYKTEKGKWSAAITLVTVLVVFIPLLFPFSMIIDNKFQASLWNFSLFSPILCAISAVVKFEARERVNMNLFSQIPIHYLGILFYLLASLWISRKAVILHKKEILEVQRRKESFKRLQEKKID